VLTGPELATVFADAWRACADRREVDAALAGQLAELIGAARRELAAIAELAGALDDVVDGRALVGVLAARAPAHEVRAYLARCHVSDLALAQAASRGNPAAIAAIERVHRPLIESVCWRYAGPAQSAADLGQILRERLYVAGPGASPRIADYAGQGPLAGWLRITAVRCFIDLGRRKDRPREAPSASGELALPDPSDLSLEVIKTEYRGAVSQAMRDASAELDLADRHVLHQHFVAGLSIDQLGVALGIHRATAARRVVRAREALVGKTRALLAARLRLASDELDDVIGMVLSRLDVSIPRLLAPRASDGPG
jgi:RNA polymerase sigma-70 factor, ECF subfamily